MATTSKKTGGGSRKGSSKAVSLADVDRQAISERLGAAKSAGAAVVDSMGGLFEALERFGLTSERVERLRGAIDDMEVRESVEKAQEYLGEQIENARDYAKENPGKVIGGAAGVLVGASLLAMALRRAGVEGKRSSGSKSRGSKSRSGGSSKKSSGSSKSSGSKKSSGSRSAGSKSRSRR